MGEAAVTFRPARLALLALAASLVLGALVLFLFDPGRHPFYPVCFFHRVTGLLCPGCGGLRGLHQLLHGQVGAAFRLNPMMVISAPFVIWVAARCGLQWARSQPISVGLRPAWLWAILAAVLVVSVLRNLPIAPFDALRP